MTKASFSNKKSTGDTKDINSILIMLRISKASIIMTLYIYMEFSFSILFQDGKAKEENFSFGSDCNVKYFNRNEFISYCARVNIKTVHILTSLTNSFFKKIIFHCYIFHTKIFSFFLLR